MTTVAKELDKRTAMWLWPNLLSVDAPIIALLWQEVFAHDTGVRLMVSSRMALGLAVWLIYIVDRLLDTRNGMSARATARHEFYCSHRVCCYLLAATATLLAGISVMMLPKPVFRSGLVVAGLVGVYFVVVHSVGGRPRSWFPKEAAVGLLFAVGAGLAPFARASDSWPMMFPALMFGVMCWVNTAAIESWEGGTLDGVSNWAVDHIKPLSCGLGIVSLMWMADKGFHWSEAALVLAAIGFWAVADVREKLNAEALRVGIDIPLLAPLLLIGFR